LMQERATRDETAVVAERAAGAARVSRIRRSVVTRKSSTRAQERVLRSADRLRSTSRDRPPVTRKQRGDGADSKSLTPLLLIRAVGTPTSETEAGRCAAPRVCARADERAGERLRVGGDVEHRVPIDNESAEQVLLLEVAASTSISVVSVAEQPEQADVTCKTSALCQGVEYRISDPVACSSAADCS